jgi:hypothetical protein
MTAYVIFLIVLWLGIFTMLVGAAVVLLALFGGGTALCLACRRLTGLRRRSSGESGTARGAISDENDKA